MRQHEPNKRRKFSSGGLIRSEPNEVDIAITVPKLYKAVETGGFFRRLFDKVRGLPTEDYHGAQLMVCVVVMFPDGCVKTVNDTITGKTLSPYTRQIKVLNTINRRVSIT